MKNKKSYLWRIFTLNMLIAIPLLISSMVGVFFLRYETFRENKRNSENLFYNTTVAMNELLGEYRDKATIICTKPQLSKSLFEQKGAPQIEAFGVLNTMMIADSRLTNMFLDFDMEYLCSMEGLVEDNVFLKKALACDLESASRGVEIIRAKKEGTFFLRISDQNTLLFLGVVPDTVGSHSAYVGFVFDMKEINKTFRSITVDQWYVLQAADGSSCAIGFDASGQAHMMSGKQIQEREQSNKYDCLSRTLNEYGLTINLYSEKFLFSVENEIWNIQIFNIVLLIVAIALSLFLSWQLGEKRIRDLMIYRDYLESGNEPDLAKNHALHILNEPVAKLREYEQLSIARQQELNQQLTYSLLCGMIDKNKIPTAIKKLGINKLPERFCVIAISGVDSGQKDFCKYFLGSSLYIEIHEELIDGIICLHEMPNTDTDLSARCQLADSMLEFSEEICSNTKIGFSKVYTDLSFIEGAYKESLRSLRFLLVDNKPISYICAEEVAVDGKYIFPDSMILSKIEEALSDYDYSGACVWCERAVNRAELNGATKENALFVRFSILQKLVEFFAKEYTVGDNELLGLCKEIDISNNNAFLMGVKELLAQATMEREQKDFAKVIQYIDANYQRYDLSHNEVAEVAQVNPGHLSKLFRNKFGVTYIEYLISVRMEKAAELLANKNILIEDVARVVGYDNVASFRKMFKRKYGVSPAEYRTQVLNKENE